MLTIKQKYIAVLLVLLINKASVHCIICGKTRILLSVEKREIYSHSKILSEVVRVNFHNLHGTGTFTVWKKQKFTLT